MSDAHAQEEQFLLYVLDESLAGRLQHVLESTEEGQLPQLELDMRTARCGILSLGFPGQALLQCCVSLHEVPTIIETFKSHNHVNLVKSSDIGQVLMVHGDGDPTYVEDSLATLIEYSQSGDESLFPTEMARGLTPPMLEGRKVFKYQPRAEPALVEVVEKQLIDLMHGEAPDGWTIEDIAEVWVADDSAKGGKWMPLEAAPAEVLKGGAAR